MITTSGGITGLTLIAGPFGIGSMVIAHIPKGWTHHHQRIARIALCTMPTLSKRIEWCALNLRSDSQWGGSAEVER
ncbi:MAG: hypothetical protein JSR96_06845 [Proteobacteria bacterium]|nr:hypothetical protein [Pseudomonadota bacterium]